MMENFFAGVPMAHARPSYFARKSEMGHCQAVNKKKKCFIEFGEFERSDIIRK